MFSLATFYNPNATFIVISKWIQKKRSFSTKGLLLLKRTDTVFFLKLGYFNIVLLENIGEVVSRKYFVPLE